MIIYIYSDRSHTRMWPAQRYQVLFCPVQRGIQKSIIDWETAKQYSLEVMQFFGARTVWTQLRNIIALDEELQENPANETDAAQPLNAPSTSQLDECPNEIEYEK